MSLVVVIGGIRSGKSEVAERLAAASGAPVCYLATASADDPEMSERIARHRRRRPVAWRTVSTADPTEVTVGQGETLLIDGIGPWLARLMLEGGLWTDQPVAPLGAEGQAAYRRAVETVRAFARTAADRSGLTVLVAEESGLGLVPQGAAARRYLDLAGEALQELARAAERVLLVVAGRVTVLGDDHRHARAPLPPSSEPADPARAVSPGPAATAPNPAGPAPAPGTRPTPAPGPGPASGTGPGALAELRLHGDTMVAGGQLDFAVNVVPGGPPGWLRDELAVALEHAAAYPNESDAVAALAGRHGRAPDEVLPTNGSAEAFWLLAAVLQPARAVMVHPTFTEPEAALRAAGRRVERAFRDRHDFVLDPAAVPADADLVILGNPNNPTGTLDPAEVLAGLARPGRLLVVDEAFMELVPGEPDSLAARTDLPGLVVIRSLTKAWSLAGVRAGYLLAPAEIVAAARAARQPWSVNGLACAALAAWARRTSASGGAEATLIARRVAAARAELAASLDSLPGVQVWPSAANFLLIHVPDGPAVHASLGRCGITVRPAHTFPGLTTDHIRLAVRDPPENRRLVEALRAHLRERDPHPAEAEPLGGPGGDRERGVTAAAHPTPQEGQAAAEGLA